MCTCSDIWQKRNCTCDSVSNKESAWGVYQNEDRNTRELKQFKMCTRVRVCGYAFLLSHSQTHSHTHGPHVLAFLVQNIPCNQTFILINTAHYTSLLFPALVIVLILRCHHSEQPYLLCYIIIFKALRIFVYNYTVIINV